MKIRLLVSEEERKKLKIDFESKGYEINDIEYDYTLTSNSPIDKIIGYIDKEIYLINPKEVLYFESFGNDIFCHTNNSRVKVRYRLYELENIFTNISYMRISNSYIVNLNQIKSIKPTMNSKFILTMNNDNKIEVTRSYYALFKRFIEGGM